MHITSERSDAGCGLAEERLRELVSMLDEMQQSSTCLFVADSDVFVELRVYDCQPIGD